MAWTTPATAVAGSTALTAAFWNEQVRDNSNFLYTPPMCIARRAAVQSIPTGANTDISLDTQDVDTDAMFAPTSTDITIKTAGVYTVSGFISWATQSGGVRFMSVKVNGTDVAGQKYGSVLGTDTVLQSATGILDLAVNDVIKLSCVQNSGSSINVTARLSVCWIGKA